MKRFMSVLCLMLIVVGISVSAFANGLSLNSIGPRALGMGGAMIGLANDPTAIYWNPAGLSGQHSGFLVFGTDVIPFANYKWSYPSFGINYDSKTLTNHYISPNLFGVYSMGKWTFGLGAYVPAGLGAEWDKKDFGGFETMSKIGVFNISPAVSYQFSDKLSAGLAVNYYYGMMEMKRENMADTTQYSEDISGTGFGVSFGVKYILNEKISLGFTYKTAVKVGFEGDATSALKMKVKRDIEWPTWIGGGIAYHLNEKWVVTADGQYSNWSSLKNLVTELSFTHPLAGPMAVKDTTDLKWKNALQIRLGTEYKWNDNLTLRGGYYYDPAPSPDETLVILFPSSTNHVLTAGCTYQMGKMGLNFGLEYLIGGERKVSDDLKNPLNPLLGFKNAQPGKHQMNILAYSLGIQYAL